MNGFVFLMLFVFEKKSFMKKQINSSITSREKDVVALMYKGLNYTEIASQLNISPATVRKHTENIYKKLGAHNKVEAIHKCIEKKIIKI